MTYARPTPASDVDTMPRMASWVTTPVRAETLEDVAFLSGAALGHLHLVVGHPAVPQALLRERLALRAAEACVGFAGRIERAGDLRDEVHLLRPGDRPGPAGEVYLCWRRAVARPVTVGALQKAMPERTAEEISVWLDTARGAAVQRAASVIEAVLATDPRAENAALMLGDAALAQSLGWGHLVPLLAAGLTPRDLRKTGDDLRRACHRALCISANEAARMAGDLADRAGRLRAVAPKLRAKAAGKAIDRFLSCDALSPAVALTPFMSDRAARRLCDRLVDLGAVRELTGRDSFRLYGV